MAFAYAVKKQTVMGDVRCVMGTFTNGESDTGGAITTGLNEIFYFNSNYETSSVNTATLTAISGGTATITTVTGEDGKWIAIGV